MGRFVEANKRSIETYQHGSGNDAVAARARSIAFNSLSPVGVVHPNAARSPRSFMIGVSSSAFAAEHSRGFAGLRRNSAQTADSMSGMLL
jgi:hypothetical protein